MLNVVRDIFWLPSLQGARLIAGRGGYQRPVTGATILELTELEKDDSENLLATSLKKGEFAITALYNIKDDVEKQYHMIETLCKLESAGLIIFYYGHIVKKFDEKIIDLCNQLDFPLIVLDYSTNRDVVYADVISDILCMKNQGGGPNFRSFISRIWELRQKGGKISDALQIISIHNGVEVAVIDEKAEAILCTTVAEQENLLNQCREFETIQRIIDRSEQRIDNYTYYGRRYYVDSLATQVILISQNGIRQLDEINHIFLCVELCLDFWKKDILFTRGDFLIQLIAQGNWADARSYLHYYRSDRENAPWHFTADREENQALKGALREKQIVYVSGKYNEVSVILYQCEKELNSQIADNLFAEDEAQGQRVFARNLPTEDGMFFLLQFAVNNFSETLSIFEHRKLIGRFDLMEAESCIREKDSDLPCGMLQPLLEYDRRKNGNIVRTLTVFLVDCNKDTKQTAKILFTHPNTVQYRVKKAAELMGISFDDTAALSWVFHLLCLLRFQKMEGRERDA
ncbi:MAG: PucR family transcriptional regulator ligand-binding domain-containing protein [Oscillospiraceae bacterium]|nr:PucR family transcriptional regulator ligand-binding domain-containing protein [Oscillospiraceae bacterium]